jgi:hypothetical protein
MFFDSTPMTDAARAGMVHTANSRAYMKVARQLIGEVYQLRFDVRL